MFSLLAVPSTIAVDPPRLLGLNHRGRIVQDRASALYV